MSAWFDSIILGITMYFGLFMILFLPIGVISLIRHKALNPMRFLVVQMFCLYMCCVFSVAFLPLPTMEQAANLTYQYQLIPFYFVYDILTKPCVSAVLGEGFNILMMVPFGILLTYYFKLDWKKVILAGFLLSLFIEIAQLTGLFFLFHGSYRLFDVDDLIANTAGAFAGYLVATAVMRRIPAIEYFDHLITKKVSEKRPNKTVQIPV